MIMDEMIDEKFMVSWYPYEVTIMVFFWIIGPDRGHNQP